jgi:hypothetical protein
MTMTYGVTAGSRMEEASDVCGAHRVNTFWIVLDGSGPTLPLSVSLPDGQEAMALFSSEEEARMFCFLGDGPTNPRLRETSAGEVISLLYCSHSMPCSR